ncbi:MAG: major capsid protein [Microviridae sp.]|nr:MAG: major capsid protein [Microviridae sp.]
MIERPDVPRSTFQNHWTRKTTFNASDLVPILCDEILPGDHMRYSVTALIRMATPLFPIFDNQKVCTFFFFVPARLVWNNWVRFMGEQDSPADSIAYTIPQVVSAANGFPANTIYDHFGVPVVGQTGVGNTVSINALPLRAYNLIFNDWFRDQNLSNSQAVSETSNGPDPVANYSLLQRAKQHDYFTSALPWPQKFTATTIPFTGTAPIIGLGTKAGIVPGAGVTTIWEAGASASTTYPFESPSSAAATHYVRFANGGAVGAANTPQVFANLAAAAGISLNQLRQTWMIQQLLERDARGGSRYVESILAHFGVRSPDYRLQRPEYIGGGSTPLTTTPVAQTAPAVSPAIVGALGAATTGVAQHAASYAATEHGYIIGLINIQTDLSYQQGLHKMWTRSVRTDFYYPSLAHLGEQVVTTGEIYHVGSAAADNAVFGYQERWQEYRVRMSEVTGLFRSTTAGTIDVWHFAEKFAAAPTLGSTFITDQGKTIIQRNVALGASSLAQQYLADIDYHRTAVRPLPVYGIPSTIGRF